VNFSACLFNSLIIFLFCVVEATEILIHTYSPRLLNNKTFHRCTICHSYMKLKLLLFLLDPATLSHNDGALGAARNVVNCILPPPLTVKVRQNDAFFINDLTWPALIN
jgi:hypothetical protein